ncbi:TPA: hypothetical protein ENS27_06130 [bacterium]|nr:hypothetical protein [bacterium]
MLKLRFLLLSALFTLVIMAITTQTLIAEQEITVGNDFGVGARAMGMAGAFTGVADDYTALHWNPAGLSHIRRMEAFGALSHEKVNNETEFFGTTDSTFVSNTKLTSFGIVFPIPTYRGGLAFAFGVNRIQSFDLRTSINGYNEVAFEVDKEFGELYIDDVTDESGGISSWDFGFAVDIAPNVALGATLSFLTGNYNYNNDLYANDSKQLDTILNDYNLLNEISRNYYGVDGKIGLMTYFDRYAKLGLTITVPLSLSIEEDWYWSSNSYYDDGTSEKSSDSGIFNYDISRPIRFNAGVAVRPVTGATISADIGYTDWTQTRYNDSPSGDVKDFKTDYKGTVKFAVGGEYYIPQTGLALRAGYMIDPMPTAGYMIDIMPYNLEKMEIESDRQYLTFGIGMIMSGSFSLDIAYVRGSSKISSDNISKEVDTTKIFLSSGFRF